MNWKNTKRDLLPEDMQEVLISVDGIYYIACFDQSAGLFRVIGPETSSVTFDLRKQVMYWAELT